MRFKGHSTRRCLEPVRLELVGLWSICLLAQRELVRAGESPAQLSAAGAIKAVQTTMRDYRVRPDSPDESLYSMLAHALLDGYERRSSKTSRDYPTKKKGQRIASPKITRALKKQINAAKEVKTIHTKIRLAA